MSKRFCHRIDGGFTDSGIRQIDSAFPKNQNGEFYLSPFLSFRPPMKLWPAYSDGASKRLNLFLRWMVRDDQVDLGLWKSIDKAKLIVPMDVHIFRVSRMLGFCHRKNISLKAAVEVTDRFAQIEPDDPVKYDFALCRIGMSQNSDDWNMINNYIDCV